MAKLARRLCRPALRLLHRRLAATRRARRRRPRALRAAPSCVRTPRPAMRAPGCLQTSLPGRAIERVPGGVSRPAGSRVLTIFSTEKSSAPPAGRPAASGFSAAELHKIRSQRYSRPPPRFPPSLPPARRSHPTTPALVHNQNPPPTHPAHSTTAPATTTATQRKQASTATRELFSSLHRTSLMTH